MDTTTKHQDLIQLIYAYLNIAPENTLLKVLELLEDEEDIRDAYAELEDIKEHGGIPWSDIKKDIKRDIA